MPLTRFLCTTSLLAAFAFSLPGAARAQSLAPATGDPAAQSGGGAAQPDPATASEPVMPGGWWTGGVDVGVRATSVDGDRGWLERYRDLRSGAFANVRFTREGEDWSSLVIANNVGYRDQRYYAQYRKAGKFRAFFEWDQIPNFFSESTESPFSQTAEGTLSLPSSARIAAQAGGSQSAIYLPLMQPVETRARRDTLRLGLLYNLTPSLDARFLLNSYTRQGTQPWSMSFGFGESVEVPRPLDERQTDMTAGLDWSDANHMLRVMYEGMWYTDHVNAFDSTPSLTLDSPLRFTNAVNSPAQGRMALPPSSDSQTITGAGMIKLPGRSQVSGNVSVGTWRQDDTLLPITINTALPQLTPDRATADLTVHRVSAYLSATSRPSDVFFVDARYRVYDFNNRSPEYNVTQVAVYDQALAAEDNPTLWSHRRQNFEVTGTYTGWQLATASVGYVLEHNWQNDRLFGVTNENGIRASVDSTTIGRLTLHGIYEHSQRNGSETDVETLTGAGEPPTLQRYDIANRTRDQVTAMAQLLATDAVAVTASIGTSRNDYSDATFGLQKANSEIYSFGADLLPGGKVSAGVAYGIEKYDARQRSHQTSSPPANYDNTSLDWVNDEGSTTNYVTANVTLLRVFPNTEVVFAYDFNRSNDDYVYTVGSALPSPAQWPTVMYEWQEFHADARYFLTPKAAIGVSYWLSRMRVNDFAFGPPIIDNPIQPGGMLLGYGARPFTGNVGWFRFQYFF